MVSYLPAACCYSARAERAPKTNSKLGPSGCPQLELRPAGPKCGRTTAKMRPACSLARLARTHLAQTGASTTTFGINHVGTMTSNLSSSLALALLPPPLSSSSSSFSPPPFDLARLLNGGRKWAAKHIVCPPSALTPTGVLQFAGRDLFELASGLFLLAFSSPFAYP